MLKNALQEQENGTPAEYIQNAQNTSYTPRVDVVENDEEFVIHADMPGVKPDALDIRFENSELTLHGRCTPCADPRRVLANEYGVGDYYRAFSLGHHIDADKIAAELKQGVLTLRLPKAEAIKPRKIEVR